MAEVIIIGELDSSREDFPYHGIFIGTYHQFSMHFGRTQEGDREQVRRVAQELRGYVEFVEVDDRLVDVFCRHYPFS